MDIVFPLDEIIESARDCMSRIRQKTGLMVGLTIELDEATFVKMYAKFNDGRLPYGYMHEFTPNHMFMTFSKQRGRPES